MGIEMDTIRLQMNSNTDNIDPIINNAFLFYMYKFTNPIILMLSLYLKSFPQLKFIYIL